MTEPTKSDRVHVASAYSAHTRKPFVEITMVHAGEICQIQVSPDEASDIARNLFEAAEAARMDALIVEFFQERVGADIPTAARILAEFRDLRDRDTEQAHNDTGE